MAHLPVTGYHASTGLLREVYEQMKNRPMPPAYVPPHDDMAGIVRAQSLDPEMLRCVFRLSGTLNGQGPLTWPQRELINAVTSRLNQCFY